MNEAGGTNILDLCMEHVNCDYTRELDNMVHQSCHRLVQVRKSVPQRLVSPVVSKAKEKLQLLDSSMAHTDENGAYGLSHGDTGLFRCTVV